ncbi:MAG: hypothetical protein OEU50_00125 [Gammaproteobacteria bacterium]|nr:hypothetical protein [Gammaproteobacteria bacterium]
MLRTLIRTLFPAFMERVEAESKTWFMQCRKCGSEISVWDYGGMRYRALGTVYRLGRCRECQKVSMLRVYQRSQPGSD